MFWGKTPKFLIGEACGVGAVPLADATRALGYERRI